MKQTRLTTALIVADHSFCQFRLAPGEKHGLLGLDLAPDVADALVGLRANGLGITLLVPEATRLEEPDLVASFLPLSCSVATLSKAPAGKMLGDCRKRLTHDPEETLFVCTDRAIRGKAASLGYRCTSDVFSARLLARGHRIELALVVGDWAHVERLDDLVPYFLERTERSARLIAAMTHRTIAQAVARRLDVTVLPVDLAIEDPLFIHLDHIGEGEAETMAGLRVLLSEGQRMLVAVGPKTSNDSIALHGAHGHFLSVGPDPGLLRPAVTTQVAQAQAEVTFSKWPEILGVAHVPIEELIAILWPRCPTAAEIQADVDRYSGATTLDTAGAVTSRHYAHPDNNRAVQALLDDLNAMGYCAYTHSFAYDGKMLKNVVADLPGRGYWFLKPDLRLKIREILIDCPIPDPIDPWIRPIEEILGADWIEENGLRKLDPVRARWKLEDLLELRCWYPWWLRLCPLYGLGAQLVVVGCHLDSTAASDPTGYDPLADPAPGADDDASGVAGTLALARYFRAFNGKLRHTVRFCFFNAEESGLVGSKAYASMLKGASAPVKAVVCMDMIGYNSDANRIFEVHAGYTDPAVRDASVPIADTIANWAAALGALAPAQIYKGTSAVSGAPDRNVYDGAINRSDHAAFHQQGYPAALASEDFFANLATEPGADPNPNYHEKNDSVVDSAYAADIACAVAKAVKALAQ